MKLQNFLTIKKTSPSIISKISSTTTISHFLLFVSILQIVRLSLMRTLSPSFTFSYCFRYSFKRYELIYEFKGLPQSIPVRINLNPPRKISTADMSCFSVKIISVVIDSFISYILQSHQYPQSTSTPPTSYQPNLHYIYSFKLFSASHQLFKKFLYEKKQIHLSNFITNEYKYRILLIEINSDMKNVRIQNLDDDESPNLQSFRQQLKEPSLNSQNGSYSSKQMSLHSSKHHLKSADKLKSVRIKSKPNILNAQLTMTSKLGRQTFGNQSQIGIITGKTINGATLKGLNKKALNNVKSRKKNVAELKDLITNQKVNGLKQLFCMKIKRNNQFARPIQYEYEENIFEKNFLYSNGIQLKESYEKTLSILSIYNIVSSIFLFTLLLVFPQVKQNVSIAVFQSLSALIILTEVILNFITVKFSLGRKLQTIKQIGQDYLQHKFPIDFCNLLIIIIYIITQDSTVRYFRIIMLLKIPDCMDKIEKLEVYFIENYYNEQYWSLFKVFLFNFCFAHMLAILLLAMSNVNLHNNWLTLKGIAASPWYQQYIWSYYWATTMMLTIGFGDIIPSCYQQALCMIFIETISCMVLAYNINCVGSLISNIRSQDIEKSKNMKIFKKLVDKNNINEELSWKINNYIEEHTNIKKLFNIEEEVQFVSKLPTAFRTDYLKQANKSIFQKVFFFNHLLQKTLFSLAEKIEMKIAHPQQIIINKTTNLDLFILKNGQIGVISRKNNLKYSEHVFDKMKVNQNDTSFLLNTNFITKFRSNYGIKSIVYSMLYWLQYQSLIEILGESNLDYQLYCQQRDKHKNKIDQFEVFPCQFCPNQKHTKFACHKLHYIPIAQQVISKQIYIQRRSKSSRIKTFERIQMQKQSCLAKYLLNRQIYNEKKKQEVIQDLQKKAKKKTFVINQLKLIDNQGQQKYFEVNKMKKTANNLDSMAKLQSTFLQNTAQIIKMHMHKVLGFEKGEDDVWLLDLDKMKNYKDYFGQNNPCNLVDTFKVEGRRKKNTDENGEGFQYDTEAQSGLLPSSINSMSRKSLY